MGLPNVSQRYDFIAAKCGAAARKWDRELRRAEGRNESTLFDLRDYLRRCRVRNPWELFHSLVTTTNPASEKDILDGLSRAQFESGHDALKLAEDLGELRALIAEAQSHRRAVSDVVTALRFAPGFEMHCLELALEPAYRALACWNDRRTGGAGVDLAHGGAPR
jgi:hypothetical protein